MEEMELLLAEAGSFADDVIVDIDRVAGTDSPDDAKDVVHEALRLGEEMMNRLEEALDFAESDADQSRIEIAITHLEDALDSGHLALTSGDPTANLGVMRSKMEDAVSHLSAYEEIEE